MFVQKTAEGYIIAHDGTSSDWQRAVNYAAKLAGEVAEFIDITVSVDLEAALEFVKGDCKPFLQYLARRLTWAARDNV